MSGPRRLSALIATRFLGGVAFQFFLVGGIDTLFRESASAFITGLIGAVLFLPSLLAPIFAAKLVSRAMSPGRLLVVTQAGVVATSLALVTSSEPTSIIVAALVFGALRALRSPLTYALMGELRDKGLTTSRAARFMSLSWQLPLVLGPLIYSLGMTLGGRAQFPLILLLLNALSLIAAMPFVAGGRARAAAHASSLRQSIRVFLANRDVSGPMLADAALNMLLGFTTLLPFLLADGGRPSSDLGLVRAALNASSLAVTLLVPRATFDTTRPRTFYASLLGLTGVTLALTFTLSFPWLLVWSAIFGAIDGWGVLYRDALIMRHVGSDALPAVASVQQVLISASDDLGEWRAGAMGEAIGPRMAMVVSAGIAGVVGFTFLRKRMAEARLECEPAWSRDSNV